MDAIDCRRIFMNDALPLIDLPFVDKMQKAGNRNDDTKKEALSMALSKAQSLMSDELKTWVSETYGDVTAYLTTLIEAQIKENSK